MIHGLKKIHYYLQSDKMHTQKNTITISQKQRQKQYWLILLVLQMAQHRNVIYK